MMLLLALWQVKLVELIPIIVLVFTNSYDAGSAARPLYYSNRIGSSGFPFSLFWWCIYQRIWIYVWFLKLHRVWLVFTNSYDAGSAARPLYYSNRNGSYRFPFGIYSDDVSINVFGNMNWVLKLYRVWQVVIGIKLRCVSSFDVW